MAANQLSIPFEEWKQIPGFPGYEVSTHGRVRSYWRLIHKGWRKGCESIIDEYPQRILQQGVGPQGYLIVVLMKDRKRYTSYVHQLILMTFIGPRPEGLQGCHNNGDHTNNYFINLRWDTPESNYRDRDKHGTTLVGIKNHKAKITEDQVRQIRKLSNEGYNNCQIGEMFSLHNSSISDIVRYVGWRHIK